MAKFIFGLLISLVFSQIVEDTVSVVEDTVSIVKKINSDPTSTWTAVEYPEEVMSLEKMRKMLMKPVKEEEDNYIGKFSDIVGAVPATFDARDQWGQLILPVRDQAQCGSCWAFAVAETVGDRLAIVHGASQGVFSPQDLVSCDTKEEGCDGGYVDYSWQYVVKTGIALDACLPYTSGTGTKGKCPTTCKNGSSITRTKAKSAAAVSSSKLQQELYDNGPLEVAFNVYTDFETYKSGVYRHKTGKLEGGHAVLLVGWGTESSTPYWLIQNSWGASWGLSGFFKIYRGGNECGIESSGYAGHF